MVNYEPEYCPYCGTELDTVEPEPGRERRWCASCDGPVWHNPVPTAGVAVVTRDDRLLLVERGVGATAGQWMVPGGHVEVEEEPDRAAARELAEETGLRIDPTDLVLLRASAGEPVPGKHVISLEYVAPESAASGSLRADSDARDARFWTPREFEDSGEVLRENHASRFGSASLDRLLETARATIAATRQ